MFFVESFKETGQLVNIYNNTSIMLRMYTMFDLDLYDVSRVCSTPILYLDWVCTVIVNAQGVNDRTTLTFGEKL